MAIYITKVKVKLLSRVWLFATPWYVTCQAPPSMRFSRQEYWNGLPFSSPGIFLTQGSNLGLPHCRQTLYVWATRESLDIIQMIKDNSKPTADCQSLHPHFSPVCFLFVWDSEAICPEVICLWASLVARMVENLPTMWEAQVQSLLQGRFPGEWNGYLFQYSFLENSMDRGVWEATVHGVPKNWTWQSN